MAAISRMAISLVSATALSGCVAAVLPVAAGSFAAHKLARSREASPPAGSLPAAEGKKGTAATADAVTLMPLPADPSDRRPGQLYAGALPRPDESSTVQTALPPGTANQPAEVARPEMPLPQDLSQMRSGQLYTGTLPGPGGAMPIDSAVPVGGTNLSSSPARPGVPSSAGAVADDKGPGRAPLAAVRTGASSSGVTGWAEVVRYVAGHSASADDRSALLARGSTADSLRWVPCGDKPPAVLASLSLALTGGTRGVQVPARDKAWIDALGTIGIKTVFVARDRGGDGADIKAAFARAGLPPLVDGDTLRTGTDADLPAIRASVGARYCVVAVAGRDAADFPNAWLPATTPAALADMWGAGWFAFTP